MILIWTSSKSAGERLANYRLLRDLLIEKRMLDELMLLGAKSCSEKNFDEAEGIYRHCVELQPDNESCHYRLGVVFARKKKCGPMLRPEFLTATRLKPSWSAPWYRFSGALAKQGRTDEAKTVLSHALEIGRKDNPETRWGRAEGLRLVGELESAFEEINRRH